MNILFGIGPSVGSTRFFAAEYHLDSVNSLRASAPTTNLAKSRRYVAVAACTILYLYPFMRFLSGGADEGTLINGAVRVIEGQLPYRDFFEVMGPGTFYWLAGFFKLLGTTWVATRVSLMLTAVLTTALMYLLSRRLNGRFRMLPSVILLGTSFPAWPAISHHSLSNLLALLSLTTWIVGFEQRRPALLFATGLLAGFTTCVMQPKGCLVFMSLLLLLWLSRRQQPAVLRLAVVMLGGYVVVAIAVLLCFWIAGGLSDLLYANVVWPLTNYTTVNVVPYGLGLSGYWKTWTMSLSSPVLPAAGLCLAGLLIIPYLVVAALPGILLLLGLRDRKLSFTRATLPYWAVGTAVWLSEIHRKDLTHLVYGSPILIILCVSLYSQLRDRLNTMAIRLVVGCSILLMACNWFVVSAAKTRTATKRGTVYTFGADSGLQFLDAHVASDEKIFVYPYHPIYYFLAAAKNPTRYSLLMYQMNTDAQFRDAVRSLEDQRVRFVLWDMAFEREKAKIWFPSYRAPPTEERIIEPYLVQHYKTLGYRDGWRLLERDDSSGTAKSEAAAVRPSVPPFGK